MVLLRAAYFIFASVWAVWLCQCSYIQKADAKCKHLPCSNTWYVLRWICIHRVSFCLIMQIWYVQVSTIHTCVFPHCCCKLTVKLLMMQKWQNLYQLTQCMLCIFNPNSIKRSILILTAIYCTRLGPVLKRMVHLNNTLHDRLNFETPKQILKILTSMSAECKILRKELSVYNLLHIYVYIYIHLLSCM